MKENDCKKEYNRALLTGERALFDVHGVSINDCIFADGESPLKECSDIVMRVDFRHSHAVSASARTRPCAAS